MNKNVESGGEGLTACLQACLHFQACIEDVMKT